MVPSTPSATRAATHEHHVLAVAEGKDVGVTTDVQTAGLAWQKRLNKLTVRAILAPLSACP